MKMPTKLYIVDVQKICDIFDGTPGPRVFLRQIDADSFYDILKGLGCKVKRYTVNKKGDDAWSI